MVRVALNIGAVELLFNLSKYRVVRKMLSKLVTRFLADEFRIVQNLTE